MSDELVHIILNHRGQDVETVVDLATANILLNDPSQAEAYLKQLLSEQEDAEHHEEATADDEGAKSDDERQQETLLWSSKGKPEANDIKGTEYFLHLRAKYAPQFDDKKTIKAKLWQKIAVEMKEAGFHLGSGAAEKCRQKFQNLVKLYIKHRQYIKQTGTGKKDPPHYYDLVHSIMGNKHKIEPQHLQDSLDTEEMPPSTVQDGRDEPSTSSAEDTVQQPKHRFQNSQKVTRPKTTNERLFEFLKKDAEDRKEDRAKQFALLDKLVDKHTEQQEKLIQLLSRKRRRTSSDSDD